jgi:hypothetical protein
MEDTCTANHHRKLSESLERLIDDRLHRRLVGHIAALVKVTVASIPIDPSTRRSKIDSDHLRPGLQEPPNGRCPKSRAGSSHQNHLLRYLHRILLPTDYLSGA